MGCEVMGSSNRGSERKHFLRWIVCRVQGRLRGRQQPPHDGSSREELPVWTPHSAANSGAPHQAEWLSPRPGRDVPARPCFGRKPQKSDHTAAPAVRSNISPDRSIACIVTARRRATATAARLKPTRSLNLSPHVRSVLSAELRVRITVAAS